MQSPFGWCQTRSEAPQGVIPGQHSIFDDRAPAGVTGAQGEAVVSDAAAAASGVPMNGAAAPGSQLEMKVMSPPDKAKREEATACTAPVSNVD